MDTITHGIAGALIAKAIFHGKDMFGSPTGDATVKEKNGSLDPPLEVVNPERVITWSLVLGAIFPDSDVFRDLLSHDKLLIVTWHRSITHSLVLMPVWALLLAWITGEFCNWRRWEAPSFAGLSGIYVVGILSHILLDLVTTFGTMIWSPLEWSRPAWDLVFIIDFTLSAILLLPQLLAWIYANPEKMWPRAMGTWLVFMPVPLVVARLAEAAGAPVSSRSTLTAMALLTVIFLLPTVRRWGMKVRYAVWNRAGLAVTLIYVALAFSAHRVALERIHKFAELDHLQVESIGALPLPPSVWHWDGLVRSPRGVYELRMDLGDRSASESDLLAHEHRYYPDAPPNSYIEAAKRLPEVQKVMWFARFPVTRFHKEGSEAIVEISDLRFARPSTGRSPAFTYRVRFGAGGSILSQGWATR
ncbi:MAG TPA: metal-dependent hydrolase [Candidatus Dormibacteraeota bacterium]|nr:metal-dependent hydrolase [Candidatus Dormibacteraeota bacterium]